jgi:hypothetical protein
MLTYSRAGLTPRLKTLAAAAVLGMLTLSGLRAPKALAQASDEECLFYVPLDHFTASRTPIAAGQSVTLSWKVVGPKTPSGVQGQPGADWR